jgi:hypothetical protein
MLAASRGWRLAITYVRDEAAAMHTADAIRQRGGSAVCLKAAVDA